MTREHPDSSIRHIRSCQFVPPPPLAIVSCPLAPLWSEWEMFGCDDHPARLTAEEFGVCANARRTVPRFRWYRVPLFWERARGDADAGRPRPSSAVPSRELRQQTHMHAEALINQHLLHIDYMSPPSGVEVLIFVDERLAGIGGNCRPSTVSDGWAPFPAVALVGPRLAISVDDASDHHGPVVDIWAVD